MRIRLWNVKTMSAPAPALLSFLAAATSAAAHEAVQVLLASPVARNNSISLPPVQTCSAALQNKSRM